MSSEIAKEAQADTFLDYEPRTPALSTIALANLNPENKSRLRRELYQRLGQAKFSLDEVLLDGQQTLVEAYLPRRGRMPSQEVVAATRFGDPRTEGFKRILQRALIRVDRRYFIGERAIETLKPTHFVYSGILNFRIRIKEDETFRLVTQVDLDTISELTRLAQRRIVPDKGVDIRTVRLDESPYLDSLRIATSSISIDKVSRLQTLEDVNRAGEYPAIVASICGALPMFYEFRSEMQKHYPNWPGWQNSEDVFSMARNLLYLRKEIFGSL